MRYIPEPVVFEWNSGNSTKNLEKHDVTIQEAEEIFFDHPFVIAMNNKHSTGLESRYQALGKTNAGRKLFTAFTVRAKKVRVISIRDMKRKERIVYERFEKNS